MSSDLLERSCEDEPFEEINRDSLVFYIWPIIGLRNTYRVLPSNVQLDKIKTKSEYVTTLIEWLPGSDFTTWPAQWNNTAIVFNDDVRKDWPCCFSEPVGYKTLEVATIVLDTDESRSRNFAIELK